MIDRKGQPLFRVLMPFPPSLNHLHKNWRKSPNYRQWQRNSDDWLRTQRLHGLRMPDIPFIAPLRLTTDLHPANGNTPDLDNVGAKAILDRLQAWQIIDNDSSIHSISMNWDRDGVLEPGTALAQLWRMK